jgi:hypothetical protein
MIGGFIRRAVRAGALQRIPEPFKAPLRPFIRPEQLYDVELHKLGLDAINAGDVFLCSYPKSGNTWLRFLIANLLRPEEVVTFRNIDRFVPDIRLAPYALNKLAMRPVMKTHWPFVRRFPRTIYICRDPRDVYVSYFHYSLHRGWYQGDMHGFLRADHFYYGAWHEHVEAALAERTQRPQDLLFLTYERLLAEPHVGAAAVAGFLGLELSEAEVAGAVEKASFARLRENERMHGGERSPDDRGFFRRGVHGSWRGELSQDDLALIVERHGGTMRRLGYLS